MIPLSLILLSCLPYPGSGALMGIHGLHLINRTSRRMWLDPRRAIFWSSVMLIFPCILSMRFSMPFLTTPSGLMTTGTVFVFNPHIFVISTSRSLHLDNFSVTFTDVFRSAGIAISISMHVFSFLSLCQVYYYGSKNFWMPRYPIQWLGGKP